MTRPYCTLQDNSTLPIRTHAACNISASERSGTASKGCGYAPSSTPVRTGRVPVTRPSGAPAVTKRIARRM